MSQIWQVRLSAKAEEDLIAIHDGLPNISGLYRQSSI